MLCYGMVCYVIWWFYSFVTTQNISRQNAAESTYDHIPFLDYKEGGNPKYERIENENE